MSSQLQNIPSPSASTRGASRSAAATDPQADSKAADQPEDPFAAILDAIAGETQTDAAAAKKPAGGQDADEDDDDEADAKSADGADVAATDPTLAMLLAFATPLAGVNDDATTGTATTGSLAGPAAVTQLGTGTVATTSVSTSSIDGSAVAVPAGATSSADADAFSTLMNKLGLDPGSAPETSAAGTQPTATAASSDPQSTKSADGSSSPAVAAAAAPTIQVDAAGQTVDLAVISDAASAQSSATVAATTPAVESEAASTIAVTVQRLTTSTADGKSATASTAKGDATAKGRTTAGNVVEALSTGMAQAKPVGERTGLAPSDGKKGGEAPPDPASLGAEAQAAQTPDMAPSTDAPAPTTTTSGKPESLSQGTSTSTTTTATGPSSPQTALPTQPAPNLPHVAYELMRQSLGGKTHFRFRLDPSELGSVDVRMNVDQTGAVTAHLTVERSETLDMFQRDRPSLERAMAQAGFDSGKTNLEFSLKQNPFAGMTGGDGRQGNGNSPTGGSGGGSSLAGDDDVKVAAAPALYRSAGSASGLNIFA